MEIGEHSGQQPFTVFVEGNMGCGKSTFLEYIKTAGDFLVLEEPIEKWTNLNGQNLLDLKYKDPNLFQFPFQSYATITRLRQHLQPTNKPIKFMERSLLTAQGCFVEYTHDKGILHSGMYEVLKEYNNFINEYHPIRCDVIIYLRTTPEVAMSRVQTRARKEEAAIVLDYMSELHERHETLLAGRTNFPSTSVIIIDANKNLEDIKTEYERCLKEVQGQFEEQLLSKRNAFIQI